MRRKLTMVLAAAAGLAALAIVAIARRPSLRTITFGGVGPPTLVLLHGFGSSARRW